ncbi:MAG: DUF4432 family protein [Christensenellales bacterium]|jgi:hypothetical protein
MREVRMHLFYSQFDGKEKTLLESGGLSVSAFRYPGGVCALRARNDRGELVILPFQGQQIWSARFSQTDLTMKSTFDEPIPTHDYLRTYGGFLLHCGATAMGVPSAADTHPLHGELPNIPYEQAYAAMGADERGRYLAVGGRTRYTVAFGTHYAAEPEVRLYEGETVARVSMTLTNLRSRPMEYMYLCHINFRPVDGSRIVDSAYIDPAHVKVFHDIPSDMSGPQRDALAAWMDRIAQDPTRHQVIDSATQVYDPEIVLAIRFEADADGWAHSMARLATGGAFYTAFRPEQLPVGVRWIARTGDEDALGLVLPATGEHKGYAYAKEHGQVRSIPGRGIVRIDMITGYLGKAEADAMEERIQSILR